MSLPYVCDRGILINLLAAGCLERICQIRNLAASDKAFLRPVRLPAWEQLPKESVESSTIISMGVRLGCSTTFGDERFLKYACHLPDPEADACALAESMKAVLVTDSLKVRNLFLSQSSGEGRVEDSSQFLQSAFNAAGYPVESQEQCLRAIEGRAAFCLPRHAGARDWWSSLKRGRNGTTKPSSSAGASGKTL